MTKTHLALSSLLFAGIGQSLIAQTFKVGDYVDADRMMSGKWEPCRVTKALEIGQYGVACGPNAAYLRPSEVRARVATAEDKRVEAETAAALARQPRGNSLGAQYGTREPVACASRTAPARGGPSAEQARQYFICDHEVEYFRTLPLVTNVKVQVAAAGKPMDRQVTHAADIDPAQPVWDIRGSFTEHNCEKLATMLGAPLNVTDFAKTHNCSDVDQPNATGSCWKNTFGDWHCAMSDTAHIFTNVRPYQLPPAGN